MSEQGVPVNQLHAQADFERHLSRVAPKSYVTSALVAINTLIFIAMAVATSGDSVFKPDGRVHIDWGSNFGPLTSDGQWWRLFTCTFLHFGFLHLALNMYALYDGGRFTERLYGHAEFLALYVVSGLTGSVASLLWNPLVNSAGASGAIFGVYGAMVAYAAKPGNRLPATMIVLEFLRLRAESLTLLAAAVRTGDRNKVLASNEKSAEAVKALEKLKQLNKAKK